MGSAAEILAAITADPRTDCTVAGWHWYCDVHNSHGNADFEEEAVAVAAAHEAWQGKNEADGQGCDITVRRVNPPYRGVCTRCGESAIRIVGVGEDALMSLLVGDLVTTDLHAPSYQRGCRAATFTPDDGWDDSIPSRQMCEWTDG